MHKHKYHVNIKERCFIRDVNSPQERLSPVVSVLHPMTGLVSLSDFGLPVYAVVAMIIW
jgi:hypothetical protein